MSDRDLYGYLSTPRTIRDLLIRFPDGGLVDRMKSLSDKGLVVGSVPVTIEGKRCLVYWREGARIPRRWKRILADSGVDESAWEVV